MRSQNTSPPARPRVSAARVSESAALQATSLLTSLPFLIKAHNVSTRRPLLQFSFHVQQCQRENRGMVRHFVGVSVFMFRANKRKIQDTYHDDISSICTRPLNRLTNLAMVWPFSGTLQSSNTARRASTLSLRILKNSKVTKSVLHIFPAYM
jgi:hypothetical protein